MTSNFAMFYNTLQLFEVICIKYRFHRMSIFPSFWKSQISQFYAWYKKHQSRLSRTCRSNSLDVVFTSCPPRYYRRFCLSSCIEFLTSPPGIVSRYKLAHVKFRSECISQIPLSRVLQDVTPITPIVVFLVLWLFSIFIALLAFLSANLSLYALTILISSASSGPWTIRLNFSTSSIV